MKSERIAAERGPDANKARPTTIQLQIQINSTLFAADSCRESPLVVPSNADRVCWVRFTVRGSDLWAQQTLEQPPVYGCRLSVLELFGSRAFCWSISGKMHSAHMGHHGIPHRAVDGCYRYSCPQPIQRGGRIGSRMRFDRRFRFPGGGSEDLISAGGAKFLDLIMWCIHVACGSLSMIPPYRVYSDLLPVPIRYISARSPSRNIGRLFPRPPVPPYPPLWLFLPS